MINPDIEFFQNEDQSKYRTDYVDNSDKGYKEGLYKDGYRLIIIRPYIFGNTYIWRKCKETDFIPIGAVAVKALSKRKRK